ncbi:flavin reductase family protein [Nesterenkonia sp. HG001]|uniref:flavin reductase family protein n=1 Tax=Nesterenkonia sp. HG001 TaxID=2983207 RepID=UPI002AC5F3E8|nr:flavin reductase family protein [Nesterenkonia sp. HG001]MDZ5076803.1 flavin reductase family protein [Nesterenkonia sp. HG001]
MRPSHFYEPTTGHGLPHDPFNAIVGPRPIGWVSTQSPDGRLNLAPYSFFNAFNYTPPLIGFSSIGHKDSVANIEATGEFCWNLVTAELGEQMNQTSAAVSAEIDEFELAGLTPEDSRVVGVPHVGQAQVVFECRRTQTLRLTDADGQATPARMVFGEVVGVHIEERLLEDGVYQTAAADPLLRGGGPADYFRIRQEDRLRMRRPQV